MDIPVPLLVIVRRVSRSCMHCSRTRMVCTLKVWCRFGINDLCVVVTFGVLDEILDIKRSSRMVRGKDLYMGSYILAIGKVLGFSGIVPGSF